MTREEAIERFSKYYSPVGDLHGNPTLHVGHQSFSFDWEEDPEEGDSEARRKWFGDMLCIALARMFEEQLDIHCGHGHEPNAETIAAIEEAREMRKKYD